MDGTGHTFPAIIRFWQKSWLPLFRILFLGGKRPLSLSLSLFFPPLSCLRRRCHADSHLWLKGSRERNAQIRFSAWKTAPNNGLRECWDSAPLVYKAAIHGFATFFNDFSWQENEMWGCHWTGKIKLKLQGQTTATSERPFAEKGTGEIVLPWALWGHVKPL